MENIVANNFAFSSSVKADVWHSQKHSKSYEWWYFDAVSDDGKEAVAVVFLDNFIYSPRYNRETGAENESRFPAVSFTYFRDGKAIYRAVNEYNSSDFHASEERPECRIGDCSFKLETASYGSGYVVTINASLPGQKKLTAHLEWLSVEADFAPDAFCYEESRHCWNMVVPRADVTGKISVFDKKGVEKEVRHFRGTGYHDHNLDNRWLAKTLQHWHWGRAHFADSTAVFYRYREVGDDESKTKFILIRDGEMTERDVEYEEQDYIRDRLGIRYPKRLKLASEDNMRLHVEPLHVIDSSFYFLRFLSEITLSVGEGPPRKTVGITEFIAPKTLKYRWLNWLSDIRTGKKGKSSYF